MAFLLLGLAFSSPLSKTCKGCIAKLMDGPEWGKGKEREVVSGYRQGKPSQKWTAAEDPQKEPDDQSDGSPDEADGGERNHESGDANHRRKIQCRFHEALGPCLVHSFYILPASKPHDTLGKT